MEDGYLNLLNICINYYNHYNIHQLNAAYLHLYVLKYKSMLRHLPPFGTTANTWIDNDDVAVTKFVT